MLKSLKQEKSHAEWNLNLALLAILLGFICLQSSCSRRNGCTDPAANNYSAKAENDDGSCRYDNEIFNGLWKVSDTIINGKVIKPDEEKTLTILSDQSNKAEMQLVWKRANSTSSDTLYGNLVPLAISIPYQAHGTYFFRGSVIYLFYSDDPVKKIRLSYTLTDAQGNSIEYRGTGEKLP